MANDQKRISLKNIKEALSLLQKQGSGEEKTPSLIFSREMQFSSLLLPVSPGEALFSPFENCYSPEKCSNLISLS